MEITQEQLIGILPATPQAAAGIYVPLLNLYMPQFGISTPARVGSFLAQIGEESADFRYTKEIASGQEYEGRKDLGNVFPGDGAKFKGRGLIQITGRNMYNECSHDIYGDTRLLDTPQLLEAPDMATRSACWFWDKVKNLNAIADLPDTWVHPGVHQYSKFQWMTILINGGLNGYNQRIANYQRAKTVLGF